MIQFIKDVVLNNDPEREPLVQEEPRDKGWQETAMSVTMIIADLFIGGLGFYFLLECEGKDPCAYQRIIATITTSIGFMGASLEIVGLFGTSSLQDPIDVIV